MNKDLNLNNTGQGQKLVVTVIIEKDLENK